MKLLRFFCIYLAGMTLAFAAPGAHGPNGEHLDGAVGQLGGATAPRLETFTEMFELVAHLQGQELSILIDRYPTNEPVVNGKLEVEFKGIKAPAKFHADHGDYSVDDARLVKALAQPGKHALLFTLTAGDDSDLLEGTLDVKAQAAAHAHDAAYFSYSRIAAAIAAALTIVALMLLLRRRQRLNRTST